MTPSPRLQAAFRDWVVGHQGTFTVATVHQAIGVGNTQARNLVLWGLHRKVVVEAGRRPARGGGAGRPAQLYRYLRPGEVEPARLPLRQPVVVAQPPRRGQAPSGRTGLGGVARKEVRQLLGDAAAAGWRVQRRRGHYLATPPGGGSPVSVPATPSDHRSLANARAAMRQRGLARA